MAKNMPDRVDDLVLLKLLDLRDNEGMNLAQAGRALGMTRSAACGKAYRVRQEEAQLEEDCAAKGLPLCACTKPENRDGGMPRRWWK